MSSRKLTFPKKKGGGTNFSKIYSGYSGFGGYVLFRNIPGRNIYSPPPDHITSDHFDHSNMTPHFSCILHVNILKRNRKKNNLPNTTPLDSQYQKGWVVIILVYMMKCTTYFSCYVKKMIDLIKGGGQVKNLNLPEYTK